MKVKITLRNNIQPRTISQTEKEKNYIAFKVLLYLIGHVGHGDIHTESLHKNLNSVETK